MNEPLSQLRFSPSDLFRGLVALLLWGTLARMGRRSRSSPQGGINAGEEATQYR